MMYEVLFLPFQKLFFSKKFFYLKAILKIRRDKLKVSF